MRKTGYTLIEIIIVVGILGIIATVGSVMFFSILKSSTKTKIFHLVKQDGDYALSVMVRMIRNARELVSPTEDSVTSSITIKNPDGRTTTFACDSYLITSNSASLISSGVKVSDCNNIFDVKVGEPGIKPAEIKINFSLTPAEEGARPEEKVEVDFQTGVILRNY